MKKKRKPIIEQGAASLTITLKRGTITVNHFDGPELLRLTKVEPGAWEQIVTALLNIKAAKQTGTMASRPPVERGAMGLPYTVAGAVAQELADCAVDRSEVTREQMVAYLTGDYYDEDEFWNLFGGPATDWFESNASEVEV